MLNWKQTGPHKGNVLQGLFCRQWIEKKTRGSAGQVWLYWLSMTAKWEHNSKRKVYAYVHLENQVPCSRPFGLVAIQFAGDMGLKRKVFWCPCCGHSSAPLPLQGCSLLCTGWGWHQTISRVSNQALLINSLYRGLRDIPHDPDHWLPPTALPQCPHHRGVRKELLKWLGVTNARGYG